MASPDPSLIRIPHPDPSCCPGSGPGRVTRHPRTSLPPLLLGGAFTFSFQMQPLDHSAAESEAVWHAFQEKAEPVWGRRGGSLVSNLQRWSLPPGNTMEAWGAACSGRSGSTILTNWRNPAVWTGQWGLSSGLERLAWGRGPTAPHPFGRTPGENAQAFRVYALRWR